MKRVQVMARVFPSRTTADSIRQLKAATFTVSEVARMVGVSRVTIDIWLKKKALPHSKIGATVLIDKERLETWMQAHRARLPSVEAFLVKQERRVAKRAA